MTRIQFTHTYQHIISVENLLEAWKEFIRGKRSRKDVLRFERNLMSNIFALHKNLTLKTYRHSSYEAFNISDPKPRNIHKASVRDRLLHHAMYRILYTFFDRTFIADSYSCRLNKGTHKALERFKSFSYKASENHTKTVWVLKCDIRKFFASINQKTLIEIIKNYIPDKDIVWLISEIIRSFYSIGRDLGLPLGNLTSQLFVNVYMNEFDHYVKHKLKVKYFIRYADDFVIFSQDEEWLEGILSTIKIFLQDKLKLTLHPDKISIKTIASGIDFLGWIHFPSHRVLRTITKKRMFKRIRITKGKTESVQSYLGLLSQGNSKKLQMRTKKLVEIVKESESRNI